MSIVYCFGDQPVQLATPMMTTTTASVKARTPMITVRLARWSRSGTTVFTTTGGGSRLIFDTRVPSAARLTEGFGVESGLALESA